MSIYRKGARRARKAHICEGCATRIEPGESYLCLTMQYEDGRPVSSAYHEDCRGWEEFLCQENDLAWDEWITLAEHVAEGGPGVLDGAPDTVRARFASQLADAADAQP